MDADHRRSADLARGRCFPAKARDHRLLVGRERTRDDLERDELFEHFIVGEIDGPHAALAEESLHAIALREHLPRFDRTATTVVYDDTWGQRGLDADGNVAAYPFGHGLSYTTFAHRLLRHDVDGTGGTATVQVTNTGDRPIQVGSHFHFYETNTSLSFDREAAREAVYGMPYSEWKKRQPEASQEQLDRMAASVARNKA